MMIMTKKFALFNLDEGGFLTADGGRMEGKDDYNERKDYDLLNGAIFTEETAKERGIDLDESKYLAVPITQNVYDYLPIDMEDTAPDVPFGEADLEARREALKGDFVVLSPEGFYDERYYGGAATEGQEWSSTKVRGYNLNYANLYSMESLEKIEHEGIVAESKNEFQAVIVPVSDVQQEKLKQLPEFSPKREPYGFFMEPLGDAVIREQAREAQGEKGPEDHSMEMMPDLGEALNALESESQNQAIEQ